MATFMDAMGKAYGQAATEKLFQDFNSCLVSSRSIIRRRRTDLSSNWPADAAAEAKLIGNARLIRYIKVYVRPGMGPRYEELLLQIKGVLEKNDPHSAGLVSQVVAGERGGVIYYIAQPRKSFADFDGLQSMMQMMGDQAFREYQRAVSELVTSSEVTISMIVPSFSNPPAETAAAAPDFWNPKPPPPPKPPAAAKAPAKKS